MRLSVPERMKLLELLPDESSYAGVVEIFRLVNTLRLTDEEAVQIEVNHNPDGSIMFNQEKAITLIEDIPIGEWMTTTIREVLVAKNAESSLDINTMSIYEKFIMDYA